MGCVSSKGDINDRHPNVFHVWNVDERGNLLIPGEIEITESELILYQKGKDPIRWPMRCLRRYGLDAELFSFESGRRCTTGPGIYAFRCRRAEALFNLLQESIQNSGQDAVSHVSGQTVATAVHPSGAVMGNGMASTPNGSIVLSGSVLVSSEVENYLEPIVRHRTRSNASRDGFTRMPTQSLPNNLAFAASGQQPTAAAAAAAAAVGASPTNGASPHYANEDVTSLTGDGKEKGSGSLSLRSPITPPATQSLLPEYANMAPIAMAECDELGAEAPVAAAADAGSEGSEHAANRISQQMQQGESTDNSQTLSTAAADPANSSSDARKQLLYSILDLPKNVAGAMKGSNGCRQVILRGHSLDDNTNYARPDELFKQEHTAKRHLYMNVIPNGGSSSGSQKKDAAVATTAPLTHGCSYRDHFYANVGPSGRQQKTSDTSPGAQPAAAAASGGIGPVGNDNAVKTSQGQPTASRQVNYAVLDLNHRGSNSSSGSASNGPSSGAAGGGCEASAPTSPTSLATPPEFLYKNAQEGYATIDFDRTVALSNSANPCLDDDESIRKTRHNSNISDLLQNKHGSVIGD